jgi:crotonobetainyl-CoA:carnitine CoA-transferase CaiB-like acyl-CoA transferase
VQAAGQIADLGGGALMAAFGIMTALRERDGGGAGSASSGSGEGQLVDVSMADGALSWLAMVAAAYFADGIVPRRGHLPLAGALICYRPYECADGWMTLGALEPKFWQEFCRGVGREELIAKQFERPGSDAHTEVKEIFIARTRAQWEAFAREHDCCLEPVLELDEALSSELVGARGMVVDIEQSGSERAVRQLGIPVKLARTPGEHGRLPGPALGEHTEMVLRDAGYSESDVAELLEAGAVAGPSEAQPGASVRV